MIQCFYILIGCNSALIWIRLHPDPIPVKIRIRPDPKSLDLVKIRILKYGIWCTPKNFYTMWSVHTNFRQTDDWPWHNDAVQHARIQKCGLEG